MIREKKHFLKTCHAKLGGGGLHCSCCAPSGRKGRKAFMRAMRRSYNQAIDKLTQSEMD